ncbi:hypothetical protein EP7_000687 [Isosphaeraceae bacterium EP7]
MAKLSIGIRSAMVITVIVALMLAVTIQSLALREQGRKVAALEARARNFSTQNAQITNIIMQMNMEMNKSVDAVRKRLDKVEREVAPVKP